jgi:hypothetical protein
MRALRCGTVGWSGQNGKPRNDACIQVRTGGGRQQNGALAHEVGLSKRMQQRMHEPNVRLAVKELRSRIRGQKRIQIHRSTLRNRLPIVSTWVG